MYFASVLRRNSNNNKTWRVAITHYLILIVATCINVRVSSFSNTICHTRTAKWRSRPRTLKIWKSFHYTALNKLDDSLYLYSDLRNLTTLLAHPTIQEEATINDEHDHIENKDDTTKQKKIQIRNIPKLIVRIYADYASRLWNETNNENRKRIANDHIVSAIRKVQKLMMISSTSTTSATNNDDDEYSDVVTTLPEISRQNLQNACEEVLSAIQVRRNGKLTTEHEKRNDASVTDPDNENISPIQKNHEELSTAKAVGLSYNGINEKSITSVEDVSVVVHNGASLLHFTAVDTMSSNGRELTINAKERPSSSTQSSSFVVPKDDASTSALTSSPKKKSRRSIAFGALMGTVVACWVFSGNYLFTGLFTMMTVLGQLEYYRMIMNTGIYPARRISIAGACSMFLTALLCPDLHQICLPMFGLWTMIWFLTFKRHLATINEIATTFTGMFYLGYVPSFWVRIRLIGMGREPTRLAPIVGPILSFIGRTAEKSPIIPQWLPQAIHLPITTGAIFIFWTWLCIAFSDVGAYFVGKNFGKTKLSVISPVAGLTSPNKSIEGVIGGCTVSALLAIFGAWVQRWPYPILTGAIHGTLLGLLGLIGDLTASMLKRDAGLKDFGDLLPEHGGIMDRVDSFIWAAPYSWLVCAYIIPSLKQIAI